MSRIKKILLIIPFCLLLTACSFSKISDGDATKSLLDAAIKSGATAKAKKSDIQQTWTSKIEGTDDIYTYYQFNNNVVLKIPNNSLSLEIYVDSKVNNPTPGLFYIEEYSKRYVDKYKEIEKNHMYSLELESREEIIETTREEEISQTFNINWLIPDPNTVDSMSNQELMRYYINIRLFEAYYRNIIVNNIISNNSSELSYEQILSLQDKFKAGDVDASFESFIFNVYSGQDSMYAWINFINGNIDNTGDLVNSLIEKKSEKVKDENIQNMREYVKNITLNENNLVIFKDVNLFFNIKYLDKKLKIPKSQISKMQHIDAYNRMRE